jgi:hypothetical protein
MRGLEKLKDDFVSVLVLAHTPKRRPWEPLTELDLQGSVNLGIFADSVFAMGRSRHSRDLRYLKQIKTRSGRTEIDESNVAVFSLAKFDFATAAGRCQDPERVAAENFLGFKFVKFDHEYEHLELRRTASGRNVRPAGKHRDLIEAARALAAEGKSAGKIAAELGISRATAYRYAIRKG